MKKGIVFLFLFLSFLVNGQESPNGMKQYLDATSNHFGLGESETKLRNDLTDRALTDYKTPDGIKYLDSRPPATKSISFAYYFNSSTHLCDHSMMLVATKHLADLFVEAYNNYDILSDTSWLIHWDKNVYLVVLKYSDELHVYFFTYSLYAK